MRWRKAGKGRASTISYMNHIHHQSVSPNERTPESHETRATAAEVFELQLAEQKDRYLRLAADFDNFRKRTSQETARRAASQKEALIHELLPVIDNLERGLAVGPDTSFEQLLEGVGMTLQQFKHILRQNDVEAEECQGMPFDPLRHEAIGSRHDPSKPDNIVLETAQRGYRRGKEILRPARVIVNDLSK
jgi:molecular chaperone GrpE